jgi:hypothetical protein
MGKCILREQHFGPQGVPEVCVLISTKEHELALMYQTMVQLKEAKWDTQLKMSSEWACMSKELT